MLFGHAFYKGFLQIMWHTLRAIAVGISVINPFLVCGLCPEASCYGHGYLNANRTACVCFDTQRWFEQDGTPSTLSSDPCCYGSITKVEPTLALATSGTLT